MLNVLSAFLIFSTAINALRIEIPSYNSRQIAGSTIPFLINQAQIENVRSAALILEAANDRQQVVTGFIPGIPKLVTLSIDLLGATALTAVVTRGEGFPGTSEIFIYRDDPIPIPINPCYPSYNPCYTPLTRCEIPRSTCEIPRSSCEIPRNRCEIPRNSCNIPRPRCRIRSAENSESSDAVEFTQSEFKPEIIHSGFVSYTSNDSDDVQQFESHEHEKVVSDQDQQA